MSTHSPFCLHCTLVETVRLWIERHGEPGPRGRTHDAGEILDALGKAAADVIAKAPEKRTRRRLAAAAHHSIDDAIAEAIAEANARQAPTFL